MQLTRPVPRWSEPGLAIDRRLAGVPAWLAWLGYVVVVAVLWEAGYEALMHEGGAMPVWLAAGAVHSALLASPVRRWPALAVISMVAGTLAAVHDGRPLATTIAFHLISALQAVGGAWLVRLATPRVTTRTLRGVASLILGPGAATALVAAGWRLAELLRGVEHHLRVDVFWIATILGVATLGWMLAAWAEETPPEERPSSAALETLAGLGALALAIGVLQLQNSVLSQEFLLVPPVIWLAVRFGPRGASVGVLLATLGTIWTAWSGRVVLGLVFLDPVRTAFSVQLFVAALSVSTAFVSALVAERRAADEGRALLARAMDQTVDGLGVYAEDGTILWANAAAARFYGAPLRELLGRRAWEFFPGGTLARWKRRWEKMAVDGVLLHEQATRGADGRTIPWELSTALVSVGGRQLAVAAIRDVSDRQRAGEALRLAGIGTLAAGVAHEINNPLASVVGNLALVRERLAAIRERGGAPELARFADEWLPPIVDAEDGARRVREVVAELRVFARAEAVRGPTDVGRAMRSALSLAQSEIQHRARLVTRIADVPPVFGSEGRLAQAFANVLVNAARAIPEGASQENEIRVEVRASGGQVVAEVADTGVGMSQEVRARIFEPFFTTRDIGEGSGLGLAVTHAIVTAMHGTIDVDSAPGAGTRLRIVLPVVPGLAHPNAIAPAGPPAAVPVSPPPMAPAAPPAAPGVSGVSPPAGTLPPAPAGPSPTQGPAPAPGPAPAHAGRLRVLVVDDEPLVARSLQRILSREHDVEVADRARAALDRIASGERFDVVLCDLMMPDVSGMAFHDEVGILDAGLRDRVVFVTGGAFTEAARDFLDRVTNLRLEKPVDPTTLRATVRGFTPRPPR